MNAAARPVPTASAASCPTRSARPVSPAVLCAELLRSHRTFTWASCLVGLASTLFCVRLAASATANHLAAADGRWDGNVLGWLSFYPFVVVVPLGLLVGALAQTREVRWREGGTAWRAVSPRRLLVARLAVLGLACLACQVAVLAPVLLQSLVHGEGWGPVTTWLTFSLLMVLTEAASAAWGLLAARLIGRASVGVAPMIGLVWSAAGAVRAEAAGWHAEPWTWMPHAVIPLLGVHGNSVNLEPNAAGWGYAVWPGLLSTVALGALAVLVLLVTGGARGGAARQTRPAVLGADVVTAMSSPAADAPVPAAPHAHTASSQGTAPVTAWVAPVSVRTRRPATHRALASALPWAVWAGLGVLLAAFLLIVRVSYSPARALNVLTLLGVPVAACVVGTMTLRAVADPWRLLLARRGPGTLLLALVNLAGGALGVLLLVVGLLSISGQPLLPAAADGGGIAAPAYALLVTPFVAVMLVAVSMAVTQWLGLGASIAVGMLGLLDALVIAGNESLCAALWRWAPWGWAAVAGTYPSTWFEIIVGSVGLTVLALLVMRGGTLRAARSGGE